MKLFKLRVLKSINNGVNIFGTASASHILDFLSFGADGILGNGKDYYVLPSLVPHLRTKLISWSIRTGMTTYWNNVNKFSAN